MQIADVQALVKKAAAKEDQTKRTAFTGAEPPAAGRAMARFIEYVEMGIQPQPAFQGKPKAPAPSVRLVFELFGKKYTSEIEVDGVKKIVQKKLYLTINKSLNKKAKYARIMDEMLYGRDKITHVAAMLGEAFIIDIVHRESVNAKKEKKTFANLDKISAPFMEDPETGDRKAYAVPKPVSDLKVFLFDTPTIESWESLFIEAEGKNFIQETIKKALNFKGSELEDMLSGADQIDTTPVTEEVPEEIEQLEEADEEIPMIEETPAPKAKAKALTVKVLAKATPKAAVKAKPNTQAVDAMAQLGLID